MTAFNRAVWDQMPNLSIYMEAVHRLTDRGAVVTHVAHGVSQDGFDAEWRMIFIFYGRWRPDQRLRVVRRGRSRRRARKIRRAQSAGAAIGKRGKPSGRALSGAIHGPRLGRHGRDTGRRRFSRRSSSRRGRGRPTWSGCRNCGHAGDCRRSGSRTLVGRPLRPAGGRLILGRARFSGREHRPERRSTATYSASSRSTPTTGSRRRSSFDPDDSTPRSRNSMPDTSPAKRPPTRTRGRLSQRAYAALNRRELPATTPDWVNIDHRRGIAVRARRSDPVHPCRVGRHAGQSRIYIEAVHRLSNLGAVVTHVAKGTSQEGFDAEWREIDVTDGRRRPDQPLRDIRRGRHRRRARKVRRTQSAGAST